MKPFPLLLLLAACSSAPTATVLACDGADPRPVAPGELFTCRNRGELRPVEPVALYYVDPARQPIEWRTFVDGFPGPHPAPIWRGYRYCYEPRKENEHAEEHDPVHCSNRTLPR